jgi:hypothetical protein
MSLPRAPSKTGQSLQPGVRRGRAGPSVLAAFTQTLRDVLPGPGTGRTQRPGAAPEEDTAMHSPCL